MTTVTLVVVGIWNGLLLSALVFVLLKRRRIVPWVTGADEENRNEWERREEWREFLAQHPELTEDRPLVQDRRTHLHH
jgi:hypothetical protein